MPKQSPHPRSTRRSAFRAAAGLVLCVVVGLGVGATPVAALPTQDPALTTTTVAVPGSTTTIPAATTTEDPADTTTVTSQQTDQRVPDTAEIDEENRKFALIVAGLVAVAVALALLTIRYWRMTKPDKAAVATAATEEAEPVGVELDDDELFVDVPTGSAAPTPVETPAVAPAAVVATGRRSRRAIAGADHADVDEGWEPMATGEQERVSGQVRRATSRPSAKDRARAFEADDGS